MSPRKKDQPQNQPAPWPELPLMELQSILDGHQNPDGAFTRPAGLPDRLYVPTDLIMPGRWQPRSIFVDAEINSLAESIQEHGILTALKVVVNDALDMFELVAGERRLQAADSIGVKVVPIEILAGTEAQMAEIAIVDNVQRADLSPLEEGTAYQKLIDAGLSESEVARKMGKSRGYIQQRRALAGAAPEVAQALVNTNVSLAQVRGLLAGAGSDHGVQCAALRVIGAMIGSGMHVNEERARERAADTARREYIERLKKRGWIVSCTEDRIVVFSPTDRPRTMSLVDLAELDAEQRYPAPGDPPAQAEISETVREDLALRGWIVNTYAYHPWIAINRAGSDGGPLYITSDEISDVHSQAIESMAALDHRAEDIQCSILWRENGSSTRLTNNDGLVSDPLYTFGALEQAIERAERGELQWHQPERCARCEQPILKGWRYTSQGQMHLDCYEEWTGARPQVARPAQAAHVAQPALDYEIDIPTGFEPAPTDPELADLQRMAWISMMSRPDALALAVVLIDQLGSDIVATIEELDQVADSELQEVLAVLMREMVDLEEYHRQQTATG